MTNLQLLLAIGIPTLAVIVSMIQNNGRFNAIEARIGSIEARIGGIDGRLISIEADLRRFFQELGRLAGRIESLEQRNR
jgi:hypothetical protein